MLPDFLPFFNAESLLCPLHMSVESLSLYLYENVIRQLYLLESYKLCGVFRVVHAGFFYAPYWYKHRNCYEVLCYGGVIVEPSKSGILKRASCYQTTIHTKA